MHSKLQQFMINGFFQFLCVQTDTQTRTQRRRWNNTCFASMDGAYVTLQLINQSINQSFITPKQHIKDIHKTTQHTKERQ